MTQEDISLAELDRRMAYFEPYIPRADVMEGLHALHDALEVAVLWRRIGLASAAVAFMAVTVSFAVLVIGTSHASELLVFQKLCMTAASAEALLKNSEIIAANNLMCIAQHDKDREYMQAVFAREDNVYKSADKAGFIYTVGKHTYEDVSVLPNAEVTDLLLRSEEPGRRPGFMVQAVQQQNP